MCKSILRLVELCGKEDCGKNSTRMFCVSVGIEKGSSNLVEDLVSDCLANPKEVMKPPEVVSQQAAGAMGKRTTYKVNLLNIDDRVPDFLEDAMILKFPW